MYLDIIRNPLSVYVQTEKEWLELEHGNSGAWSRNGVEVGFAQASGGLQVTLKAEGYSVRQIRLRWETPVSTPLSVLGDHWERGYGDLEWRGIVPERIMPWYFMTHDGVLTNGYGVKTGPAAMCSWQLDSEGVTLLVDVRCGHAGVQLGERTLDVCTVVSRQGAPEESAFEAATRFCRVMCEAPALPPQPVYGGNNWYYAYGRSSHEQILKDSAYISSLAPLAVNRPYMVIDDGWQLCSGGGACNGGPWTGNYHFPDMAGLAAEMKQLSVKPGIWCRPLLVSQHVPDSWKRYAGNRGIVLDPTVPEVLDYVADTISTLSSWGYELIKHDFTTFDLVGSWGFEMRGNVNHLPHTFRDRSKTTAEIVLQLYETIAKASGNSVIIGCNTIGHLAAGLFEVQRTGDDTSGRSWERTRRMGINTLAFRMPQHNTFFSHDADCVGLTSEVPWELNKQWLELLSASGTPLFVSVKPHTMTPEQEAAVRRSFELAAQTLPPAEPLDWLHTTCPAAWKIQERVQTYRWSQPVPRLSQDNEWWS